MYWFYHLDSDAVVKQPQNFRVREMFANRLQAYGLTISKSSFRSGSKQAFAKQLLYMRYQFQMIIHIIFCRESVTLSVLPRNT